jgi:N-acetylmuramoyl-L-alanine amidase
MTYAGLFKTWATVLAAILASILLSVAAFTTGAGAQEQPACTGKIPEVVLDPGHGGTDSGAINQTFQLKEKDQNLLVAQGLARLLSDHGHCAVLTRTGDRHLTNTQRANIANDTGADILVSIHMNGSTNETVDYTTTLYGKPRKDKELAYALFGGSVKPPSYGLRTLPAADDDNRTIATRTPYQFASGVLLKSNMPAVIAESVFITNIEEGDRLSDGTGIRQQQIAEALRSGIEQYLDTH